MTRGAKDKEDGRIQKSCAGEDERGVRMSKTRRGEKGKVDEGCKHEDSSNCIT